MTTLLLFSVVLSSLSTSSDLPQMLNHQVRNAHFSGVWISSTMERTATIQSIEKFLDKDLEFVVLPAPPIPKQYVLNELANVNPPTWKYASLSKELKARGIVVYCYFNAWQRDPDHDLPVETQLRIMEQPIDYGFLPHPGYSYLSPFLDSNVKAATKYMSDFVSINNNIDELVVQFGLNARIHLGFSEASREFAIKRLNIDPIDFPDPLELDPATKRLKPLNELTSQWHQLRLDHAFTVSQQMLQTLAPRRNVHLLIEPSLYSLPIQNRSAAFQHWLRNIDSNLVDDVMWVGAPESNVTASQVNNSVDLFNSIQRKVRMTIISQSTDLSSQPQAESFPDQNIRFVLLLTSLD